MPNGARRLGRRRGQHDRCDRGRCRHRLALPAEPLEVERDGSAHFALGVLDGVAECDAARQIGRPGAVPAASTGRLVEGRPSPSAEVDHDVAGSR